MLLASCGTGGSGNPVDAPAGDPWTLDIGIPDTAEDPLLDSLPLDPGSSSDVPTGMSETFNQPCESNLDCVIGWCIHGKDGDVCTDPCVENCPQGWACKEIPTGGPDIVLACAPSHVALCRPCNDHKSCADQGYQGSAFCRAFGTDRGSFCVTPCSDENPCPEGHACTELEAPSGKWDYCLPMAEDCECDGVAIHQALWTACSRSAGSGTCTGRRTCVLAGLSDCDAVQPAEETCNGLDDDCDGDTDEGLGETTCGLGVCTHTVENCVDGKPGACDPLAGAVSEVCNGADDDCDGQTDEELGQASCGLGPCLHEVPNCTGGLPGNCDPFEGAKNESCNGADDDCDGDTDEDLGQTTCGVGPCFHSIQNCVGGGPLLCDPQEGAGPEVCNGKDDDCDGQTDEGELCSDALDCTIDVCWAGSCSNEVEPGTCLIDGTCFASGDGRPFHPCMACRPEVSRTAWSNREDGTSCEDADLCTIADTCLAGACVGVAADCDDGEACTEDACNSLIGCTHVPLDVDCDDHDSCSVNDHCEAGKCKGGAPLQCDDGNPCTTDSCGPSVGCTHTGDATGPCDDTDPCTESDACDAGKCVGIPVFCDDGKACTEDACDGKGGCMHKTKVGWCLIGGQCVIDGQEDLANSCQVCDTKKDQALWSRNAEGTSCDDVNPCTTQDRCTAGACAGLPLDCDDGLACTKDSCGDAGTCVHERKVGWCLIAGSCWSDGQIAPSGPCRVCAPGKSQTQWSSNVDGTECDDGDDCTFQDRCEAGVCTGTALGCDDGKACTEDACDGKGGCTHKTKAGWCLIGGQCWIDGQDNLADPCQVCAAGKSQTQWSSNVDGTACDDANPCTKLDRCVSGVCGGSFYSCSDGKACTDDLCDGAGGCTYTPKSGFCLIDGTCQPDGQPDPGNECRACRASKSQSQWSARDDGTSCNDAEPCTNLDQCTAGACHGSLYSCDDGKSCTADGCDGTGGCTNVPKAGSCLINGQCWTDGQSNPANPCQVCIAAKSQSQWSRAVDGTTCNDGNACTKQDRCLSGICGGILYSCDDKTNCTDDACDGAGACVFSVKPGSCLIATTCFSDGQANPGNSCQVCAVARTQSGWSSKTDGTTCSGGTCVAGTCCTPQCTGKDCGSDGCGGSCGPCLAPATCDAGKCSCKTNCAGKACGGDGCGGVCGLCADGEQCNSGVCDCIGQHAGDTWEPDECWSHAKPLVAGVAQEHSINPAGDKDWFVFSLDKASDVTFKVWGAAGYLNVYWYGPDNAAVELDYNSGYLAGSGFTLSRTNLPVGKYWFRAGSSSLIGSYDVLLTVNAVAPGVESPDAGNDASTAQILPSGVTQEHVIKPSGDKDWYTVTLDQASDVGFKIWGPSGYMSVYWYGPDDSTVELDYNSGNLAGSGFTLSRTNLPVGKYWFRAGSSSLIGSYSVLLTVKTVAPGVENPDAGNDSSSAQTLVSGVAQEHAIKPLGDKDWYTVTLSQASDVSFKIWGPSGYMSVYWYGPDDPTVKLDYSSGYLAGSGFTLSRTNLPVGKYWFRAGSSDLVGSYNVLPTVKTVAPGVENPDAGNDSSTAQPLVSGVAQEHVIKPQGDKDWFVVALGQASNVDFKLWGPSGYMTVYEYGPDSPTQSLDHKSGYLDGSGFTLSGTNLPAGMYWFKAYSSDLVGSYYVLLTVKAL